MTPLVVSLVQTNLIWEDRRANLAALTDRINDLPPATELVVLPEMFSTGFSMNAPQLAEATTGETMQALQTLSAQKKIVITGSLIIKEDDRFYNRLAWILPNGDAGYYDKRHLFAFAGEHKHYSAGSKRLIARLNGWRLNLQVCYDLRFPVWSRNSLKENTPEFDVLVYVANWPAKRSHAWKSLLVARAIENQCYVIGVNRVGVDGHGIEYVGDSMIIDPLGAIVATANDEACTITETLDPELLTKVRTQFPFLRDADRFTIY